MVDDWHSSDWHFGHKNILHLCNRPWSTLEDMHRDIKERINSKVKPLDNLYIEGDASFMQLSENVKLFKAINGKKHLILGNHDKLKRIPTELFESVQETLRYSLFQPNDTLLCHYPFKNTKEEIDDAAKKGYKIRYLEKRPDNNGQYLIHGHIHNKMYKIRGKAINMSVEQWDYFPVHVDEIRRLFLAKQDILVVDNDMTHEYHNL